MNVREYGLITFYSTHHALKAEKILKNAGVEVMMIPIPKEITANCGSGVKFNIKDLGRINSLIKRSNLRFWGCYKIEQYDREKQIEKISLKM